MNGPGELTLTSIVLFTLGAYGVAAGAASGEQSVVAVGVFAFTLFVLGIVIPIVTLNRLGVEAWAAPDAMVGAGHDVHLRLSGRVGRVEVRVVDPPGAWWRTAAPTEGIIPRVAARRGVFHTIRVELRSSAPLGVFVRSRFVRVALPVPLSVAPRPTLAAPRLWPRPDDAALSSATSSMYGAGDTVRAVRPYVPGDAARLVHWPTSARRGSLVVREHEPPPAVGLALVVDLSGGGLSGSEPGEGAEAAASRAAGIGRATLAAGGAVWLCTREAGGPVSAPVVNARDLGRRLAAAEPGDPGAAPQGWSVEVVRA
jgi:uncharacterized protein (DUF58 family)